MSRRPNVGVSSGPVETGSVRPCRLVPTNTLIYPFGSGRRMREAIAGLKPPIDFSVLWRIPLGIDIGNDQLTLTRRQPNGSSCFVLPFLQPGGSTNAWRQASG